ncbi:MAG: hypothetical protein ACI9JN_000142 [Bacteroidia bacterium]|jgi:hypothetical protein
MPKLKIAIKTVVALLILTCPSVLKAQVLDTIPPVVTLNTADTVYHEVNYPYNPVIVTVTDNNSDSSKISITKSSNVNPYHLGIYTDRYTVTDSAGNEALKIRWVIIGDTTPPTITSERPVIKLQYDKNENLIDHLKFYDNYTAPSDLKDSVITVFSDYKWNVAGFYLATFITFDESGNYSRPFTLYIDVFGPVISVQGIESTTMLVYPNPATDLIKITNLTASSRTLKLYDVNGRQVLTKPIVGSSAVLDVSLLLSGVYQLNIISTDGIRSQRSIIQ